MDTVYFSDYGLLEWLEPADYYAEPWTYVRTERGDDAARL